MTDIFEPDRENVGTRRQVMTSREEDVRAWFVREVLPLEAALTRYLQHNWRGQAKVADMLHDVYVRVIDAARKEFPKTTPAFVFATARNLLVDLVRQEKIVPFETVENLEALNVAADTPPPDEQVIAREQLRNVQKALDQLHPRSREVFIMYHVDGLSRREIAARTDLSEVTVNWYLNLGVRLLADLLYRSSSNQKPLR
jgi:RNA polymerase sigma factor (sigma-70 family)